MLASVERADERFFFRRREGGGSEPFRRGSGNERSVCRTGGETASRSCSSASTYSAASSSKKLSSGSDMSSFVERASDGVARLRSRRLLLFALFVLAVRGVLGRDEGFSSSMIVSIISPMTCCSSSVGPPAWWCSSARSEISIVCNHSLLFFCTFFCGRFTSMLLSSSH